MADERKVEVFCLDDGERYSTSLDDFCEANNDHPDLCAAVRALKLDHGVTFGGGAAPAYAIRRIR